MPVKSRLPYSIHWLSVAYSGWSTGTMLPGKHSGHVGQPRPELVTRTIAPVIAISACVATTASATPSWSRRLGLGARSMRAFNDSNGTARS